MIKNTYHFSPLNCSKGAKVNLLNTKIINFFCMKRFSILWLLAMSLFFCGCDKDDEEDYNNALSEEPGPTLNQVAKQLDMIVVVPIHPSSLQYFDYVIRYYDNRGVEHNDTIQESSGGIVVGDWNYVDIEITLDDLGASLKSEENFYVRTYSYDNLFVSCSVTVEMIPKVDFSTEDLFYFYIPKPYISPNIDNPKSSIVGETVEHILKDVECIKIESMTIDSFQSEYGRTFSSHCGVYNSYVGYEIFFY